MSEWQQIESVPDDETVVMFYIGKEVPVIARADDYWYGRKPNGGGGFAHWLDGASHWMPLPEPPQTAST